MYERRSFSPRARWSAPSLDADVVSVDLNADGSIGTASLAKAEVAGWYDCGPAPGQPGAAVLDAHVDSSLMSDYRGAFFYLGLAKPGMRINLTRADTSATPSSTRTSRAKRPDVSRWGSRAGHRLPTRVKARPRRTAGT